MNPRHLFSLLAASIATAACTVELTSVGGDAGTADGSSATPDAATPDGSTPDAEPDSATNPDPCGIMGTWEFEGYFCGSTDVSASWLAIAQKSTLVITQLPAGGCKVVTTYEGKTCKRTETSEYTPSSGSNVTMNHLGFDSCTPTGCTFYEGDTPCATGAGARSETGSVTATPGTPNRFEIEYPAAGLCTGDPGRVVFRQK